MAWHNKGNGVGISLWFAIFYSLLTAGVALALVIMPKALVETSTQPIAIDQAVQSQQIKSRLWETNEYTGRTNPFVYTDDLTGLDKLYTMKLLTYKVTLGNKSTFYDEKLYKRAKPIAKYRYETYVEHRKVSAGGTQQNLTIEELIKRHGIEIAAKDADNASNIIQKYAQQYFALPKGSYTANCTATKECTLTLTSKEPLHFIETSQETYLPVKPPRAQKFSLTLKVKWG